MKIEETILLWCDGVQKLIDSGYYSDFYEGKLRAYEDVLFFLRSMPIIHDDNNKQGESGEKKD